MSSLSGTLDSCAWGRLWGTMDVFLYNGEIKRGEEQLVVATTPFIEQSLGRVILARQQQNYTASQIIFPLLPQLDQKTTGIC